MVLRLTNKSASVQMLQDSRDERPSASPNLRQNLFRRCPAQRGHFCLGPLFRSAHNPRPKDGPHILNLVAIGMGVIERRPACFLSHSM
ncbi:hypothetical protein [Candidatus Leptofilum sp.]|uniref:hypothetical protein n=1 Tax=Candidatus Leptofilum sp. TaxID=3241576 RepID=UPI003B5BEB72